MFLQSSAMSFGISVIGVIVFTGLAAYDTQKLKYMGGPCRGRRHRRAPGHHLGALTLYLDFLNLFLMLLRLFGSSRD
jgi:FtsH-binding integral membrane protein